MRSIGNSRFQTIYLSSLTAIALLVAASHMVIDSIVAEEARMAEVNEIGSHQRMLSERIIYLLLEYAMDENPVSRAETRELIRQADETFDRNHKLLIRGQISRNSAVVFEDNIDSLFFDGPEYLDERARLFLYNIREVLAHDWSPELISSYYLKELRKASREDLNRGLNLLGKLYTENSKTRIKRLRIIVALLLGTVILLVIGIGIFIFKPLFNRIVAQHNKLQYLAFRDPLTDIHNRRSFLEESEVEFRNCRESGLLCSFLFLDIDYLKVVNDTFGHAMGDKVIQEMARICRNRLEDTAIFGRIGGDEFGILLPGRSLESATHLAEQLRMDMSSYSRPGIIGDIQISISIGVATIIASDKNAFETISRADSNLYEAKRTGRNLIIAA